MVGWYQSPPPSVPRDDENARSISLRGW